MKVDDSENPQTDELSDSLAGSIHGLSDNAKTAGDLFSGITEDVSRLVRLEIELAKQEFIEIARPKALAAGLGLVGLVLALFIVPFLLLTVFEIFDVFMPRWLAALVTTLLLAAGSAGLFFFAKTKIEGSFKPERTINSLSETMRSLKESLSWPNRTKR
ncbi:MAG: phage holin family protein [Actinomycetota bacterium]